MRVLAASGLLVLGTGLLAIAAPRPEPPSLTVALAGDVMLGRGVATVHASQGWASALQLLAPYFASTDIASANLESPLTAQPLVGPGLDLRAPPQAAEALQAAGLTLVSLANNHSLDSGEAGLGDTLRQLASAGLAATGPDPRPFGLRHGSLRLAWLAFDDTTASLSLSEIRASVAAARQNADLVVVSVHWGGEWEVAPNPRQRLVAGVLATAGADLIVGHHPHVVQPIQWIWAPGRGRPTLVAYSLGNTLFDQAAPPATRQGALILARADAAGVHRFCALPFEIDPQTWTVIPAGQSALDAVMRRLTLGAADLCRLPSAPRSPVP